MSYTYQTITLDDYFNAGEGQFESVQTNNPPNKLSLGPNLDARSLTLNPDLKDVAVLSLLGSGSGNTIVNQGRAGDGTLLGGTWETTPSGTNYLSQPHIRYDHHSSMVGVNKTRDEPTNNASGLIVVRNPGGGTLFHKGGFARLTVSSGAAQVSVVREFEVSTGKKGGTATVTDVQTRDIGFPGGLLNDGFKHAVSFRVHGQTFEIVIDGFTVASETIKTKAPTDDGKDLYVGADPDGSNQIDGDVFQVIYVGSDASISAIVDSNPTSGFWASPVIDLGTPQILDRVTRDGYLSNDHGASLTVRLSDTEDFRRVRESTISLAENFTSPDRFGDAPLFPRRGGRNGWLEGRYARFELSMDERDVASFSPYLENVKVRFREQS